MPLLLFNSIAKILIKDNKERGKLFILKYDKIALYIHVSTEEKTERTMSTFPTATEMTMQEINDEFRNACDALDPLVHLKDNDPITQARIEIIYNTLKLAFVLTESSNGIPSLRGLGLENSLLLAQKISTAENLSAKNFSVHLRILADSISL